MRLCKTANSRFRQIIIINETKQQQKHTYTRINNTEQKQTRKQTNAMRIKKVYKFILIQ